MTDCINEEDLSVQNAEISSTHEPKAKINCIYGDECYRRNPEHRLQFYHPGDADDISQKNENHEPICRYGALCYRKNPDHRKQFRHDVIIGTQKANDKKKKRSKDLSQMNNVGPVGNVKRKRKRTVPDAETFYDSDESRDSVISFLNDSSDDYIPSDSSSKCYSSDSDDDL